MGINRDQDTPALVMSKDFKFSVVVALERKTRAHYCTD